MPEEAQPQRKRKRRTITATDSEWERIEARAAASRMTVSRYIVHELAAPDREVAVPRPDQAEILARLETMVRVLYEVECARLVQEDGPEASEEPKRRAEAHVEREQELG